jgi:hypothetical protein
MSRMRLIPKNRVLRMRLVEIAKIVKKRRSRMRMMMTNDHG